MINFNEIAIYIGVSEFIIALFIFIFDIIPKQIKEVHLTRGEKGVDSTAVTLLTIVSITTFLMTLSLMIFFCRRTFCGMDFAIGYSPLINGTLILMLGFTWKYLYRNYKRDRK